VLDKAGGDNLRDRARKGIAALADRNWTAKRAEAVARIETMRESRPMQGDWLTWKLVEAMPADGILVHEGLTSARQLNALYAYRDRYGYHGLASGGIGWGLPAAVGAQLANPGRPVTAIIGDGSAMYSVQALWTAAHHKLPMTFVICNNGGYRIIKQRLKSFHNDDNFVGMDFKEPAIDWLAVAKGFGMRAIRVADPAEIEGVLRTACTGRDGPVLIDAVLDGTL
jgi:benzoylformate decarboxylase